MSERTKIPYADSTANFWIGCRKLSAGCQNCWAERMDKRFHGGIHWKGDYLDRSEWAVKQCLKWNKKPWVCDDCGTTRQYRGSDISGTFCACGASNHASHKRRVFLSNMSDWLDPQAPIAALARLLDTIRVCDQLQFILCTKRPECFSERWRGVWSICHEGDESEWNGPLIQWLAAWVATGALAKNNPQISVVPKNLIVLASVEDQETADKRIPDLLRIPAACKGLSIEPLLGPVHIPELALRNWTKEGELHWLIVGGESGPKARPCNVEWIRSLVGQGKAAGVPLFVKQGSGPKAGQQYDIPDDLWKIKEFPKLP